MRLRTAREADAGGMAAIHAACFAKAWSEAELATFCRDERAIVVVAEDEEDDAPGGGLGGFVILQRAADIAEVLTLGVSPDQRRRGIGVRLMQLATQIAFRAGAGRILLDVNVANHAAIALYEGLGYRRDGLRPGYYDTGAAPGDAVLMSLDAGEAPQVEWVGARLLDSGNEDAL